ncbi:group II intron reverse transcriptase/maturase [Amphibacillus sp. Q70]|uniref:group II intron reverse transcriptase/maturase n=1 Tax=Amphibacillus sp. Q70 TaxID=3453416 RepID=UPI003F844D51
MTNKPFNQLVVMRDRIKANRQIKDCDKLFYQGEFWAKVFDQQMGIGRQDESDYQQFKQIFRQSMDLSQLTGLQSKKLIEACLLFVKKLFIDENMDNYKKQTLSASVSFLKRKWSDVNWIITIKKSSTAQYQLFNQLKKYIDGECFKQVLSRVLDQLEQQDSTRYQEIARDVYFTCHVLHVIKCIEKNDDLKIFIHQDMLYLGLASTKQQVIALYQTLSSSVGKEYECYFAHFSRPLCLQGYTIKRDWQLKKICIEVPQHMLIKCAHMFQYGDFHNQIPKIRGALIHQPIEQIHSIYQRELFQIANYFVDADNYRSLKKLFYFAHLSLLKTIARKFDCTMGQAAKQLKKYQLNRYPLPKKDMIRSGHAKQVNWRAVYIEKVYVRF